ncbi:MAG: hypothetical protein QW279_02845 [Candidatus Jordarchaeaceae archaeon]
MKVFLDVNIFVDVLERRAGWKASLTIVQLVRAGRIEGYISSLTPPVLYFLRARVPAKRKQRRILKRS